jgi:REP element-mobilizing transposase RayT
MTFNPEVHHRRSIRLRDYDYSRAGTYFVTICAFQRECLFGEVVDGEMRLNDAGRMVAAIWDALPQRYQGVEVDVFVAMPNHIHGIIVINDPIGTIHESPGFGQGVGAQFIAPDPVTPDNQGAMNRAPTVGEIVRAVKARCTHAINQTRNTTGIPVWQRNYYERIIRNDRELATIRQYIADNPAKWAEDENHPARNMPR